MTLASVHRRLEKLHQQSRIAAGSLIVSVFGDAVLPRGGGVWLGSLIGLMKTLGVNERLVRTTVFRLVKDDWLQTETQGRRANYRLTPVGLRRFDDAARHIYAAQTPAWDQRWRFLLLVGELAPREREALRRALRWQGFGELASGHFLHPGADLSEAMDALAADGLGAMLPQLMPLVATQPPLSPAASHADLVGRAWNVAQLARGYCAFVADYHPLLQELQSLQGPAAVACQGGGHQGQNGPGNAAGATDFAANGINPEAAFQARSLMIHDFRRLLLQDPELPTDLLPPQWPGEAARQLCAELYARLLPPSEAYLDARLQLASGDVPPARPMLGQRFAPAVQRS